MNTDQLIFTDEQSRGGRGAWFLGRFLFWGKILKRSIITLEKSQEKIDHFFIFFIWLIIFIGWFLFGVWIFTQRAVLSDNPFSILFFWRRFNPLILGFLLSLWFDLFIIYRTSQDKIALKKINYRLFDDKSKTTRTRSVKKKYNVAIAYSVLSQRAVQDAYLLASHLHQEQVEVIHLFRVLLKVKEIQNLFIRLNVDAKKLVDLVDHHLVRPSATKTTGNINLS